MQPDAGLDTSQYLAQYFAENLDRIEQAFGFRFGETALQLTKLGALCDYVAGKWLWLHATFK